MAERRSEITSLVNQIMDDLSNKKCDCDNQQRSEWVPLTNDICIHKISTGEKNNKSGIEEFNLNSNLDSGTSLGALEIKNSSFTNVEFDLQSENLILKDITENCEAKEFSRIFEKTDSKSNNEYYTNNLTENFQYSVETAELPSNESIENIEFECTETSNDLLNSAGVDDDLLGLEIDRAISKFECSPEYEKLKDAFSQTTSDLLETVDRQCQCDLNDWAFSNKEITEKKFKLRESESIFVENDREQAKSTENKKELNNIADVTETCSGNFGSIFYFKAAPRLRVGLSKRFKSRLSEQKLF